MTFSVIFLAIFTTQGSLSSELPCSGNSSSSTERCPIYWDCVCIIVPDGKKLIEPSVLFHINILYYTN
jgi:hypothetical protein